MFPFLLLALLIWNGEPAHGKTYDSGAVVDAAGVLENKTRFLLKALEEIPAPASVIARWEQLAQAARALGTAGEGSAPAKVLALHEDLRRSLEAARQELYRHRTLCHHPQVRSPYHCVRLAYRRLNRALLGNAVP